MQYKNTYMTSTDINEFIYKNDTSDENQPHACQLGEKLIPYIGWFWREVDFNHVGPYPFGVIPADTCDSVMSHMNENGEWVTTEIGPRSTKALVGFMENNKWDYPYVYATAEEWENIKTLIMAAYCNRTSDDFKAVEEAIQKLSEKL